MTKTIPLGEAVEIRGGGTPSRAVKRYWGGSIPWATVKDFRSTTLEATQEYITEDGVENSATNIIPAGAIVVPTRMAVGKAAINVVDIAINQDLKALLPRNGIDNRFLLHFVLSKRALLESRAQGATVKGITLDVLKSLEFPKLELVEQRRIAEVLDKAEDLRRECEQLLALKADLCRSTFLELFGDPAFNPEGFQILKIENCLSKERAGTQSGPFGAALKKHEYVADGVPVWGVENVQENRFINEPKSFITAEKFEELERYCVHTDDILISRAGTVGRMCIARPTVDKSIISTNLVRVALDRKCMLPEYFVSLFTYFPHRLGALKANDKDSAFTFLNPRTLRSLEIPVPPTQLQAKFKSVVDQVDEYMGRSFRMLDQSEALLAALSQEAFNGEP